MPSVSRQFQDFILDLLSPLHPMPRRMFSGVGLFCDGAMFGLLVRDVFYLRVDDRTRARFAALGSGPFTYRRLEREISMDTYYAVPDGLLDQPEELQAWARDAIGAAQAGKRPKRR